MSVTRPDHDLVEIFGFAPDDVTKTCRSLWALSACPFVNKRCTKTNHDATIIYGTCSVSTPNGDCIICPNRLYENDYAVLKTAATESMGDKLPFVMYEKYIPMRDQLSSCIVALGHNSGREVKVGQSLSMDWVLARVENKKLIEYIGVEVQSIDITGNYRDSWHSYKNIKPTSVIPRSEHGMNWANVHKRLIPQIIRKGLMYSRSSLVKSGLHFIVPEIVYLKFEDIIGADIPLVKRSGNDILTIHTYELSRAVPHGRQRGIVRKRNIKFSLSEFSRRFITGPNLPTGEVLDDAVKRVLGL